ncbi:MAG: diaminopimelate epimerase [marine bacterium B5-7]|nr:MAG: diaminopimelate epimerase [marine bacterium B5-7]
MAAVRFSKMHSLGNDFVVFDAVRQDINITADCARYIADRRRGVGCDQILLVEKLPDDPTHTEPADFLFRIFNADGSEADQCGNGARCLARFIQREQLKNNDVIHIQTRQSRMKLELLDNGDVRVDMGPPVFEPQLIPFTTDNNDSTHHLDIDGQILEVGVLSMGNPHAVTLVEDVDRYDIDGVGQAIEKHPRFAKRTNAGFMQIVDRTQIRLRVFERGVGETQACGSGACAAVVNGRRRGLLDEDVRVCLPGGEVQVNWHGDGSSVFLMGDAIHVFDGKIGL